MCGIPPIPGIPDIRPGIPIPPNPATSRRITSANSKSTATGANPAERFSEAFKALMASRYSPSVISPRARRSRRACRDPSPPARGNSHETAASARAVTKTQNTTIHTIMALTSCGEDRRPA